MAQVFLRLNPDDGPYETVVAAATDAAIIEIRIDNTALAGLERDQAIRTIRKITDRLLEIPWFPTP